MFGNKKRKKTNPLDYLALPRMPKLDLDPDTKKGIFIVFLLALGAIIILSLLNAAGMVGGYVLLGLTLALGWGRWLAPFIFLAWGYFLYEEDKYEIKVANYLGLLLFVLSFQTFLHLFLTIVSEPPPVTPNMSWVEQWREFIDMGSGGGYMGLYLAEGLISILGFVASFIITFCLILVSLMLMFNTTLSRLIGKESWMAVIVSPVMAAITWPFKWVINKFFGDDSDEAEIKEESEGKLSKIKDKIFGKAKDETEAEEDQTSEEEVRLDEPPVEFSTNQVKESAAASLFGLKKPEKKKDEHVMVASHIKIDLPFDLLSDKIGKAAGGDIKNNMMVIQRTLENFGIPVEMGEVSVGPTVTQYTFKPAEGIKLSRITTLGNDLALSLAAHPLRIEAPIPGRSLVGVEVPNQTKAVVGLREVLSSKAFKERPSNLMIALGKDVAGNAWLYDIAKMPHLLVAGATGSGKSVCLNTIIISLLYQNNPDDLKFIMVDPKRVELPAYNGIPHLLTPVITDVNKTINALKWCLNEMDRRFETLSRSGKRNIESYNKNSKERMPYLIFIIDELADLMIASPRDIEAAVIRLAQMARAVGIHLILATQRPSVDVITGLIKANMPARIAFSVASGTDSRTILDSLGAEKLLGRGDMLFITAELSKPKRIQGTFVSDLEIRKITNYIKEKAGAPNYVENITERQKVSGIGGAGLNPEGSGDDDELLDEAREMIISSGKASASVLQRRLSIGYARAARILDLLEEAGVIGPVNGSKPREILISKDDYAMMKAVREEEGEEEVESSSSYKVESEKEEKEEESQSSNIKFQNEEEELREVEERDMHEEDNEEKANKEYEDDEDDGKYFSR